ncbi:MAG: hypothetical protein IKB02_04345 [Clostridia bacterium]|nr:hypothetical protein [Clostridia bacterium]
MKKFLCLFLALLTVLLCAVSCGKPDDNVPDASNDPVTDAPTTEAEIEVPLVFKDYDLSNFKIVYEGAQNVAAARTIQTRFQKELGLNIGMIQATEKNEVEFEIIIGETSREVSKRCFDLKSGKYLTVMGLYADNGKVQLLGIDNQTKDLSIDYFFKNIVNKDTKTINVPEKGAVTAKLSDKMIQIPAKADKKYIRFVSNNILKQSINDSWDRLYGLFGAYVYMDADIYVLQEVDSAWHTKYGLTERMSSMGFEIVTNNQEVGCPIYYKADRFKLIEGGYEKYDLTKSPEKEARSFSWACLEEKATGKRLIVMGTHFIANGKSTAEVKANRDIHRTVCAEQLVAKSAELMKKYGATATVMGGDYNTTPTTDAYKVMQEGMMSARDHAPEKVNMDFATDCSVGRAPGRGADKAIDHVFYSKTGITPKHFQTIVSKFAYAYSDHVPVFLDFELN